MQDVPTPTELRAAARASKIVAYGAGLAGTGGGTLLLRQDEIGLAILIYVTTFAVGGCLIGVATLLRAATGTAARLAQVEQDVAAVRRDLARGGESDDWRHRSPY